MKATGIVRRVDDLGRVVIPKEVRRVLGIKEGDPLEIYTTKEGEVVFKKYDTINLSENDIEVMESLISAEAGVVPPEQINRIKEYLQSVRESIF